MKQFARLIRASVLTAVVGGFALAAAAQPAGMEKPPAYVGQSVAEFSYVSNGDIKAGTANLGEIDTFHSRIGYTVNFNSKPKYSWKVGMEWEQHSFGAPAASPLPNTLHSIKLTLGDTWRPSQRWAVQFEIDPGIYSDLEDIDFGDFNAPISARAAYFRNPNFFWAFAVVGNLRSELPIIGGVGFNWKFADDWSLNMILPRPQLRYDMTDRMSLFVGAEMKGGSYRVAENFGNRVGRANLNDQDVTYREMRAGGGLRWKLSDKVMAVIEGGWTVDRRFTYPDRELLLNGDGAGYFQFAVRGSY